MKLWFDASDASTLFKDAALTQPVTADGDPVGGWKDKSGGNHHATTSDNSARPIYKTGVQNNKPVVRFDGSNDVLAGTVPGCGGNSSKTLFAVLRLAGNWQSPFALGVNETSKAFALNTELDDALRLRGTQVNNDLESGPRQWCVKLITLLKDGNTLKLYENGVLVASASLSPANVESEAFLLGAFPGLSTMFLNGDICELKFYGEVFSDTARAAVENTLMVKWGLLQPSSSSSQPSSSSGVSSSSNVSSSSIGSSSSGQESSSSSSSNTSSSFSASSFVSSSQSSSSSVAQIESMTAMAEPTKGDGWKRKKVGVGELVYLHFTGGEASWTATGGSLSIKPPETAGYNDWTAPSSAGSVTITAQGENSSATITFEVVEPSELKMRPADGYDIHHHQNEAEIGIRNDFYLMPDDVNFYAVWTREEDCEGQDGTGVYAEFTGEGHDPYPDPIPCDASVVDGWGTYGGIDDAWARPSDRTPPYDPGSVYWDIPWVFKTTDGLLESQCSFSPVRQTIALASNGLNLSVEKAGSRGLTLVTAADSGLDWTPGQP